jgi:hypothetical protein
MSEQESITSMNNVDQYGGKKRACSDSDEPNNGEDKERLRDKNRTNSKRFRDRKKNYMDGLFEEKYRIGKENKELRESNEKIRMMLDEAIAENELHRRRAALGGLLHQDPGLPAANHLRPSFAADPALAAAARLRATHVEDFVSLRHPATPGAASYVPAYMSLLGEVAAQDRQRIMGDLALRGLGESLKSKLGHHSESRSGPAFIGML